MNRKIGWLLLTCVLILGMVLSSCKTTTTPTTTPGTSVTGTTTPATTTTTTPATSAVTATAGAVMVKNSLGVLEEKPQYGGIGKYNWQGVGTVGSWDPVSPIAGRTWHLAMYEGLVQSNILKGPSGTNEFAFGVVYYVPASFYTGAVASSWEVVDLQNITYHLRAGVSYQSKAPANGRAVVADDIVQAIVRSQADPKNYWYKAPGTKPENMIAATAIDKSNLTVHWPYPDARILQDSNWYVYPTEGWKQFGNLDDWRNACGTGPWIVTDYVPDSSLTYKKNPNYWGVDPFFPENKVPYADGWIDINIPDYQTGLAAIRTAQVDWTSGVTWEDAASLQKTNPDLLYRGTLNFYNPVIEMRNDLAPFSDINFRKALAIAIDRKGIVKDFYKGNGEVLSWPYFPELMNVYTPLDQLPANCQELFNYDPVKAKQLLTQAGYPTGFKVELLVPNYAPFPDLANIVKSYWDAVGVATTVNVMEGGAFYGRLYGWNYTQTALVHWSNGDPISVFATAYYSANGNARLYNYSKVVDQYVVDTYNKLIATPDGPLQDAIYKEAGPIVLAKCYDIALPSFNSYAFWQPWLKGYHGEVFGSTIHRWNDQALKKKMTGK